MNFLYKGKGEQTVTWYFKLLMNFKKVIKPGQILRKDSMMMHLAVIWIFQVQSWMMTGKYRE